MTAARPRVLAVDDDRTVLTALLGGLSRAGFDVVVATDADEALRVAADTRPALAVLDLTMGGGRGLDIAAGLAREAHTPFLMLVPARDEQEVRRRAATLGAMGVVAKPVDMTRLVPAIRAALARVEAGADPPPGPGARAVADALGGDHGPQELIALGILVERHKVNCDEAVRLLHERASAAGLAIEEVALALIEQAEGASRPPV
jgi:DNA-binding response OmpR family regulator